jgi:hypothetical protein
MQGWLRRSAETNVRDQLVVNEQRRCEYSTRRGFGVIRF